MKKSKCVKCKNMVYAPPEIDNPSGFLFCNLWHWENPSAKEINDFERWHECEDHENLDDFEEE